MTYAGGASITARWVDGPMADDVRRVTSLYSGASFDGMIDLKSYHDSILVDESGNAQVVHFGADFIFAEREVSPERLRLYWREVERFAGQHFAKPESRYAASPDALLVEARHGQSMIATFRDHDSGLGQLSTTTSYPLFSVHEIARQLGLMRPWFDEVCPGGDESYCPGCGRWQGDHRAPHKR